MKRIFAAVTLALAMSAAPPRVLAQTATWTNGTVQNVVTFDSGQLHYRQSKSLSGDKSGWFDYTVALSDIDCLQMHRRPAGDVLTIIGKHSDAVLKKADPNGTTHGYEVAVESMEIDFPAEASSIARNLVEQLQNAQPDLAKRTNTGACAP